MLAGQYVLGTLDAAERSEFERELLSSADLHREVRWWEAALSGLALGLHPASPRPVVWLNILQATAPKETHPLQRPTRRIVTTWASLATAASFIFAFALFLESRRPPPEPVVVTERVEIPVAVESFMALLQDPQSTMQWTVSLIPASNQLTIRASGQAPWVAADLDAELWLIADTGPISLGVIPKTGEMRRTLPSPLPIAEAKIVAVSLEPKGGSPTGKPTGPVVSTAGLLRSS